MTNPLFTSASSDGASVAEMIVNERCLLDCNPASVGLFEASDRGELLGLHPSQLSPEYQVSGEVSRQLANQYLMECFEFGSREFTWLHSTLRGKLFLCHVQLTLLADQTILARIENIRDYLAEGKGTAENDTLEEEDCQAVSHEQEEAFQESFNLLNQHKRAIDVSAIVSKTDVRGTITYVNDMFCEVSGYSRVELLGENHNIVNHPGMPKEVFQDLWQTIRSGRVWKGVILNRCKDGGNYYVSSTISPIRDTHGEIAEYIAIRYDITDLYEKDRIIQIQTTDFDTGLPNRVQFNGDIRLHSDAWVAVLFFPEIEGVQQIYGEAEYKDFMQGLGLKLKEYTQGFSNIYRTSDSYFSLLGHCGKKDFIKKCNQVIDRIQRTPVVIGETEIFLSVKVGVAKNNTIEKTYGHACLAMNATQHSQDNVGIYHPGTREYKKLNDAIYWAGKLKSAVSGGKIQIYGQGIFHPSGERYSTEVLMRYESGHECVSPIVFLEYAKSAGIYSSLTHEVIKQSFQYFSARGGRFSINLDREDLFNKVTRKLLLKYIAKTGCGSQLTVELLESSGVDFSEQVVQEFLQSLKSQGCRLAIDDFGSGYSNFEYLATMDVDLIKIDGSLIRDILQNKKHQLIVRSIISLCKSLEIPVVAEFAAEKEIVDFLKQYDVDYFQGYYFEKPLPLI